MLLTLFKKKKQLFMIKIVLTNFIIFPNLRK